MSKPFPRFSIVTVVYNGEKHLEETIQSIIRQNYTHIEYIIIDGGSTDNTLDIIKKHDHHIAYWVSEPDHGIYDAMNKGLARATGDYVAFMNADDWYEAGTFKAVATALQQSDCDFLTANIRIHNETLQTEVIRKSTFETFGKNIHHQTCFIRTALHKQYPYNTKYRVAADRDLIVRLLIYGATTCHLDRVVANFREGGAGSDMLQYQKELFASNRENIGLFFAVRRFVINIAGRTLFNILKIKR